MLNRAPTEAEHGAFSSIVRQRAGLKEQEIDRADRADEVEATYTIVECSDDTWFVQHPTEDERAYLVDLKLGTCECPDWQCRGKNELFRCKHLLAMQRKTGRELPQDVVCRQREVEREEAKSLDKSFSCSMADLSEIDPYGD